MAISEWKKETAGFFQVMAHSAHVRSVIYRDLWRFHRTEQCDIAAEKAQSDAAEYSRRARQLMGIE